MNYNLNIRVVIALLIFFVGDVLNAFAQTYVGAGQTYTTLTSAFNAVNNGTLTGDVSLVITSDLTETSIAVLYASGTGSSDYTSVTINSDGTTERIISGSIVGPLVNFNGADNVTIDGRFSGSGMYLRFANLNTSNPTIRFINDASNNSINYIYIEGVNTSTASGVVIISNTTGTTGNDNITIDNCHIINGSGGNPYNAIYIDGSSGAENDNLSFINSRIYGFTNYGINFRTSAYLGGNYTINNNHFYCPFISDQDQYSIFSVNNNNTGHSFTISGNYFGGNTENAGGTWIKSGGHFFGIYLNAGTGGVASSIQGNIIKNVLWTSGYGDLRPIYVTGGNADYDIGNISGNIIDSLTNAPTITTCRVSGIYSDADRAGGTVRIMNNTISNITDNSSHANSGTRGIYQNGGSSLYTIENNSIHDLSTYSSLRTSGMVGIMTSLPLQGGSTISRNFVYNLFQNNSGADTLNASGIQSSGTSGGTLIVDRNKIYNIQLANSNSGSTIYGIQIAAGFGDYTNNMISLGAGESGNYHIAGIYKPSGGSNFYYNTVYIGGSVDSGSSNSVAFFREYPGINILNNNVFSNVRSGGTGKHPAIAVNDPINLTSNYNVLYSSDPNILGSYDGGTSPVSFIEWKSGSGLDANSMNVPVSFADAAGGNLHLAGGSIGDNNLSGTPLVAVPADYDGETRNAVRPYVGADEVIATILTEWKITSAAVGNGTITPSGDTFVARGGSQSYTITPLTHYHVDSVIVNGVNQGAISNYSFSNITSNNIITSYFSIDEYIVTTLVTGSGSIIPSGSVLVPYGGNQSFVFTPGIGYHLDSVIVDGSFVGSTTNYTFTNVTANHTIHLYFSINKYTITASANGNGVISPAGSVIISSGGSQAFSFSPNAGYHLDSLMVDGLHVDSNSNYTFNNVIANHAITSYFSINIYSITATAGANGSISPAGIVPAGYGSSQKFTLIPDIGYYVDTVFVDGTIVDSTSSYTFNNISADHTIDGRFTINEYKIIAMKIGGGSITPSDTVWVNYGGIRQFAVVPSLGYHLDSLLIDGVRVDSTSSYTFENIISDHYIVANFSIDLFTISATSGLGGAISPAGDVTVPYGSNQQFIISADVGYHIDSIFVDGGYVDSTSSYTFNNVTSNSSIHAKFAINNYNIIASAGLNGSISPVGTIAVTYGSSRQFIVTPDAGYQVDTVLVDGSFEDSTTSYTFNNITSNRTIHAIFKVKTYTITATAYSGGSVNPTGIVSVNYGDSRQFIITPDLDYKTDSVLVDGNRVDSSVSYTFTNVSANHSIVAYFSINKFTIITSTIGAGSISPSGSILLYAGVDQGFTISANTGYHIDSVVVDGIRVDSITGYTFINVTANHSITAFFSIDKFTITASAESSGTITPSGVVVVNYGSDQRFIITPNNGYHVDSILVDDGIVDSTTSYTFTNISSDHTIAAYCSINIYTITTTAGLHGTITPDGDVSVIYGSEQRFTFVTEDGYHVDSVFVDGAFVDSTLGYTFYDITLNHTIFVKFAVTLNPVPTLTSIIQSSGYRGEIMNILLVGNNFIPNQTTVNVGVGMNVDSLKYNGTDTIVAFVSIEPNTILGDRNIFVVNPAPGGGTSTDLIFSIINHKPTVINLISPVNSSTVYLPHGGPIEFMWKSSIDLDVEDSVLYSINIKGPGIDTTLSGVNDTAMTMDIELLLQMHQYYRWTVSATDGYDVVASPDTFSFFTDFGEDVKDLGIGTPTEYAIKQNYPNPFNPTTVINYQLPIESWVTVKVYNVLGEEITTLVDELQVAGFKSAIWNAQQLPSGIYFVRMRADTYSDVKKIVLAK
jgi:putative cofactor-binding repeat protein